MLTCVAAVALACAAGPASASFPGRNGAIVYGWVGESAYRAGPTETSIRSVAPRSGRVRVLRDCPLRRDAPAVHTECIVSAPRYSPDGSRIAFPYITVVPDYTGAPWQFLPGLATTAADGTGLEEHSGEHRYWALAWAPRGERLLLDRELAVPDYAKPHALFLASPDGTELSQAAPEWSTAPDWSSRGEIAFVRDRSADPGCRRSCTDIFLTRLGGTPRRLTYRGGSSPSWSPHGTKLAFVRRRGSGEGNVYVVRRDGRGLRQLTRGGGYAPAWSPDGRWIAFVRDGDLHAMRSTGRDRRRLVDAPFSGLDGPHVAALDWQALPRR